MIENRFRCANIEALSPSNKISGIQICEDCKNPLPRGIVNRPWCADCSPYLKELRAKVAAYPSLYGELRYSSTYEAHKMIGEPIDDNRNN